MKTQQSLSTPELWVTERGEVYLNNEKKINIVVFHDYGIRGPIVNFRKGKSVRQVSVYRMMYEVFVLGRRLSRSEHIEPIDGNDGNCEITNLRLNHVRFSDRIRATNEESYFTWMGIDEVYC
jgi:hypothetical protein